jgi:hypothetical protein
MTWTPNCSSSTHPNFHVCHASSSRLVPLMKHIISNPPVYTPARQPRQARWVQARRPHDVTCLAVEHLEAPLPAQVLPECDHRAREAPAGQRHGPHRYRRECDILRGARGDDAPARPHEPQPPFPYPPHSASRTYRLARPLVCRLPLGHAMKPHPPNQPAHPAPVGRTS